MEFRLLGPLDARSGDDGDSPRGFEATGGAGAAPARGESRGCPRPADRRVVGREPAGDRGQGGPGLRVAATETVTRRRVADAAAGLPARGRAGVGRSPQVRGLVAGARGVNAARASALLGEALALWRGPPLGEFGAEPFARAEAGRLGAMRLAALEDRIDADLALGRHGELVVELETLIGDHPHRERLRSQLMVALYRSGRQAEALEAYRDARAALDEVGIEPSPTLRLIEKQILTQDVALEPRRERLLASAPAIASPFRARSSRRRRSRSSAARPSSRRCARCSGAPRRGRRGGPAGRGGRRREDTARARAGSRGGSTERARLLRGLGRCGEDAVRAAARMVRVPAARLRSPGLCRSAWGPAAPWRGSYPSSPADRTAGSADGRPRE